MNSKLDTKEVDVAHKSQWQTFEMVFGLPFLTGIGLQYAVPLSLPQGFLTPAIFPFGTVLIIAGTIVIILARHELAKHNQPTDPGQPTRKLVTTRVFAISRNPLYLGGICIIVGVALVFHLVWVLILLPVALVACHYILILPEERYLLAKFDIEYSNYAASVCRWVGLPENEGDE